MYILYPVINVPAGHVQAKSLYGGVRQYLRRNCIAMQLGYIVAGDERDVILERMEVFRQEWKNLGEDDSSFSIILVDAQCDTPETFYSIQHHVRKHCQAYVEHIAEQYEQRGAKYTDASWVLDRRTHPAARLPFAFVLKFSPMFPALDPALPLLESAADKLCSPTTWKEGVSSLHEAAKVLEG